MDVLLNILHIYILRLAISKSKSSRFQIITLLKVSVYLSQENSFLVVNTFNYVLSINSLIFEDN